VADVLRDEREQAAGERDACREEKRAPARERREVPRLSTRRRREGERDEALPAHVARDAPVDDARDDDQQEEHEGRRDPARRLGVRDRLRDQGEAHAEHEHRAEELERAEEVVAQVEVAEPGHPCREARRLLGVAERDPAGRLRARRRSADLPRYGAEAGGAEVLERGLRGLRPVAGREQRLEPLAVRRPERDEREPGAIGEPDAPAGEEVAPRAADRRELDLVLDVAGPAAAVDLHEHEPPVGEHQRGHVVVVRRAAAEPVLTQEVAAAAGDVADRLARRERLAQDALDPGEQLRAPRLRPPVEEPVGLRVQSEEIDRQ
jgi:hypothetical protein